MVSKAETDQFLTQAGCAILIVVTALIAAPFFLLPTPYSIGVALIVLAGFTFLWLRGRGKMYQAQVNRDLAGNKIASAQA